MAEKRVGASVDGGVREIPQEIGGLVAPEPLLVGVKGRDEEIGVLLSLPDAPDVLVEIDRIRDVVVTRAIAGPESLAEQFQGVRKLSGRPGAPG